MRNELIEQLISKHIPEKAYPEQWDVTGLKEDVRQNLNIDVPVDAWAKEEGIAEDEVRERLERAAEEAAAARTARFSPDVMRQVEKAVLLQTLDHLWREHLVTLDHLRQVIGFRGYAQRDPLNEYKTESFELFQGMLSRLREAVTNQIMRVELVQRPPPLAPEGDIQSLEAIHNDPNTGENEAADDEWGSGLRAQGTGPRPAMLAATAAAAASGEIDPNNPATWGKVQRNAPCPCGSGKKYKHCHGRLA
jgi:preprotein translocase subunit SecA